MKEGFILARNTSVGSFTHLWVFGKFVKTEIGTNIELSIKFDWRVIAVFAVINVALVAQLMRRVIHGANDWPLFLGFLVFAWAFFGLQSWLETHGLKRTIEPLFGEKDERHSANDKRSSGRAN